MSMLVTLAQAAGMAYATGINLYGTIGIIGVASKLAQIDSLPPNLAGVTSWWAISIALIFTVIELVISLVPSIASIWETLHSFIKPSVAAALAAAIAWHGDPLFVLFAALIGGSLAITTHTTKLGLRYVINASPEPFSSGLMIIGEFGLVTIISITLWQHPFVTLLFALVVLVLVIVMVRLIWRTLCQVFSGHWVPRREFFQEARTSDRLERRGDD